MNKSPIPAQPWIFVHRPCHKLGVLLTAVPALRALRVAYPNARIALTIDPPLVPLASQAGIIDDSISSAEMSRAVWRDDVSHLHTRFGGVPAAVIELWAPEPVLRKTLLDVAAGSPFIAWASLRCPMPSAAPTWSHSPLIDAHTEHEMARSCRLLEAYGISTNVLDFHISIPQAWQLSCLSETTLIHPGTGSTSRSWPAKRWAAVVAHEMTHHRVIVSAGPSESKLAHAIVAEARRLSGTDPYRVTVVADMEILELAGLVASVRRVVCGDTGVVHLAAALGTPTVSLYGPASPQEWGPASVQLEYSPRDIVLWHPRKITGYIFGGRLDSSLAAVEPREVVNALMRHDNVLDATRGALKSRTALQVV